MKKFYVAVDLGGTTIKAAIYTEALVKVAGNRMNTDATSGSQVVLERIEMTINELLATVSIEIEQIRCLGIGVPGLLDIEKGL